VPPGLVADDRLHVQELPHPTQRAELIGRYAIECVVPDNKYEPDRDDRAHRQMDQAGERDYRPADRPNDLAGQAVPIPERPVIETELDDRELEDDQPEAHV
jgi:hypothetical protein